MMQLWPEGVDLLSPDTDSRQKLLYFAGNKSQHPDWIDSKKKVEFFQALAESDIFAKDLFAHRFVDVDLSEGNRLKDEPVIVRLSQIEQAIQTERMKKPPRSDGHGGAQR